jgi:hypothetical protein
MDQQEINEIIKEHQLWLEGKEDGVRADFTEKDLRGADFTEKDLRGAKFYCADLRGANFRYANLTNADFRNVNLTNADLSNANLTNVNLTSSDLTNADMQYATLNYTILHYAILNGANFSGVNIIVLQLPIWNVYIHAETIQIGWRHHTHEVWLNFKDDEIQKELDPMSFEHPNAIEWWKKYKPFIISGIEFIKAQVAEKEIN